MEYARRALQTIAALTYYNLTTGNGGTKTLSGATTVDNNLTIDSGVTLDVSSFTLTDAGSLTNNGILNGSSGTLMIAGAGPAAAPSRPAPAR